MRARFRIALCSDIGLERVAGKTPMRAGDVTRSVRAQESEATFLSDGTTGPRRSDGEVVG
jgi:hypothetical protein